MLLKIDLKWKLFGVAIKEGFSIHGFAAGRLNFVDD